MSTEKEVERDIDGAEVGGDDGFFIGFNDNMELVKKYGAQLGVIHGSNLGKIEAIDERVKDVLFVFDVERRK
eukprot:7063416-Ditylum_brightwellii.AAC.1